MTSAPDRPFPDNTTSSARGRHRHRRRRRTMRRGVFAAASGVFGVAVIGAGYVVLVEGHGSSAEASAKVPPRPSSTSAPAPAATKPAVPGTMSVRDAAPKVITGLGPKTRAAIPASTKQVLVASGKAKNSADSTVTLWTRTTDGGWKAGAVWPAHNALRGWTSDHHAGDLHSPIGVYTLHDAGGFEKNPGSKLPYHHSSAFQAGGVGFDGEPLDEAFDYVIAIDYNRVPGHSPLDGTQPLGAGRGGGIWVHVDHGGPTHGCVSVAASHMVDLLHTLVPADHPVIVMGDHGSLAE
jgi:L,D-peptidoglycan transpeptidase YkuD (ErfK/YbiS/YcfS/YnhG family)